MRNQKGMSLLNIVIIVVAIILIFYLLSQKDDKPNNYYSSTASTEPSITKEDRSTYIAKCTKIDYESLARNPNLYIGQNFVLTGEVIQVMEDNNELTLRVNITENRYEYSNEVYYSDTILVGYTYSNNMESRVLEGDIITLYGEYLGTYTYESVVGASITVPSVYAMYIDIN